MELNDNHGRAIRRKMKFKKRKMDETNFGRTGEEQITFYRQLIRHVLIQMNSLEMKAVCLLAGHYPLHGMALPAVEQFNRECKDTKAFIGIEFHYPPKSRHVGGDHAGTWETSYLWYLRPDCVDLSVFRGREDKPLVGVSKNDPIRNASVEIGRKGCDLVVAGMVRKARALIRRAR